MQKKYLFSLLAALVISIVGFASQASAESGSSLRELAKPRNFYIGSEVVDKELFYTETLKSIPSNQSVMAREFNLMSPGLEFTFSVVEPNPPKRNSAGDIIPNPNPDLDFDFTAADAMASFAQQNGMKMRVHTLLYYLTEPAWLTGCKKGQALTTCVSTFNPAQLLQVMTYHIQTVIAHYRKNFPGLVIAWEVDNEHDYGYIAGRSYLSWRHSVFENIVDPANLLPRTIYYEKLAFEIAHKADPDALLCYNENSVENRESLRGRDMYHFVNQMISAGTPISCVSFQMHKSLPSANGSAGMSTKSDLLEQMKRYADLGMKLFITEADVSIPTVGQSSSRQSANDTLSYRNAQAQVFGDGLSACLESSNCVGYITWGFNPRMSWLQGAAEYGLPAGSSGDGLPFDSHNNPKPAYNSLQAALTQIVGASTIVEASSMSPTPGSGHYVAESGSPQNGEYEITVPNGSISFKIKITSAGLYDLHLQASGFVTPKGAAAMEIQIDGETVQRWTLGSANNQDYLAQIPLLSGEHEITYLMPKLGSGGTGASAFIDRAWLQPSAGFSQYLTGNDFSKPTGDVKTDPTANAQLTLTANTTVNASVVTPTEGEYQFNLSAFGQIVAGVGPEVSLLVDGKVIAHFEVNTPVNATNPTIAPNFIAFAFLASGLHTVGVELENSKSSSPDLTIDHLEIFAQPQGDIHLLSSGMTAPSWSVGEVLTGNAAFSQSVEIGSAGNYKISVVAASREVAVSSNGSDQDNWAVGEVELDGINLGSFTAASDAWGTYSFQVKIPKSGVHELSAKLTNWASTGSTPNFINTRNLAFHSIDLIPLVGQP